MAVPTASSGAALPWRIRFAGTAASPSGAAHEFFVDVPVLDGLPVEELFPPARAEGGVAGVRIHSAGGLRLAVLDEPLDGDGIEAAARRLYGRMIEACRGWTLYRVWNYVPHINEPSDGLETYRGFCRARSLALEEAWGRGFKQLLPAASAVGCDGSRLVSIVAAGSEPARHLENPEQLPAYEYPLEHGPRAPSFSRATVARVDGLEYVFVSGTSAIKGHATVAEGSLAGQIACTLDNLRLVSRASGLGDRLGAGAGWTRHFKIYLRQAADLAPAKALLQATLLEPTDRVTWLRSDICRAGLAIEIEATLVR